MEKNKIVTIIMHNGAEIIGRFTKEDMMTITLYRPRLLQATQNGIGLVDGVSMSGVSPDGDFDFNKSSVMYMVETAKELAAGWTQQTSGIAVPTKSGLIK
jgi:hypothetical protein